MRKGEGPSDVARELLRKYAAYLARPIHDCIALRVS